MQITTLPKDDVKRGEIYYISRGGYNTGSEQQADRPGVIVSNDKNNKNSQTLEVVYLTTQPKNELPTHCTIRSTGRVSTVLCEQIHTVAVERIGKYIGVCTAQEMQNIDIGLMISIGLGDAGGGRRRTKQLSLIRKKRKKQRRKRRKKNMNKVILMGRLTRDPQVRYTQGQDPMAIVRFTLAVDRRGRKQEGQQDADFPSCVAFGKSAEFVEKYVHQGTKIVLTGRIQTGSYTNKDNIKVYTTEVIAEDIEFAESKATAEGSGGAGGHQKPDQTENDGFMNIPEGIDEELPFN